LSTEKDHILSELLLIRCQRGDSSALDELARRWQDRLFYYIRRLVSNEDDAWDALQETWLSAVRSIQSVRNPSTFPVWLYKVARHKAMDKLRRRYNDRVESTDCEDLAETAEPAAEFGFEDAAQVHLALDRLSPPHREVLTLFFLEDLSIAEIAEVLEIPDGTVKSRLHFAKRSLREVMEQEEAAL
jgi:RNA polymerase sigma-70 factor, ECF subfamily